MGESGEAPQQRPSERYWFFPPASRRPWLTTRSRLRKTRQHKPRPGTEARPPANRRPRPPRHPGHLRRCSRCPARCFPRFPLPCPQDRPPLRRRLRPPPGRPWRPDHKPQPQPRRRRPRLRAGPGPPRPRGRPPPLEPVLRHRRAALLRRPLPRPLEPRREQPGEVPPRCPGRRPPCRGPVKRQPVLPRRPTPPGPAGLARGTTHRLRVRCPRRPPPCQRRCPSTRASPSPPARRKPPPHRKDRGRQFPPPAHCPAYPMPWCGWAPDWWAWVPLPGWCSCACAAPEGAMPGGLPRYGR